jgi:hypothetical protein
MKCIVVRLAAIAILTTSMSSFAISGNKKGTKHTNSDSANFKETNALCVVDQPKSDADKSQCDPCADQSGKQQQIKRENEHWLHDVRSISPG